METEKPENEAATRPLAEQESPTQNNNQGKDSLYKQGLAPQQVDFGQQNRAKLIIPPPDTNPADIITALELDQPDGLLLMVGGATKMSEEVEAHLIQLFSRGLARAAADAAAMIIDGGRNTGIMAMMGRGVADRGHRSVLVGIAPANKVIFPGDPGKDRAANDNALEPNHSHFVLTQGNEWGDETDSLFKLASALAGNKQVVTVLVSGDSIAKKQILQSVRHGWPVIIIRGSGGLADEIADLWQKRPPFIPDPDLAEITVEGKLHFFQLGVGSISEFERRIEQLLQFQEADTISTIELVWQRFADYDKNASLHQRGFSRIQSLILILGVFGTLLALTEFSFKNNFNLELQTNFIVERIMYYVLLSIPITVALLTTAANYFSAGNKWILLRASAESIKKEIYRYRTRTEIYNDKETKKLSREIKLERKIEALSRKLMQTEVNVSAIRPYEGPIPPENAAAPGDDGLNFLSPERYLAYRLQDQLNFYRSRTVKLDNKLRRLQWLVWIVGGIGTLLVAIGYELWIALTTSLVTAFVTYLEYQQVENTLMRYNQTATDLANVRSWWVALSTEEQADPRNIDKLVNQTETTIHSEHAAWVQEMQDAMAELRAEQTGAEASQEDDDTGQSTPPQSNTALTPIVDG